MHINEVELENFRGASSLCLQLHEQVNVFFGTNGSGKTTVLDAVAKMLSWIANRAHTPKATAQQVSELDIQNGQHFSKILLKGCYDNQEFLVRLVKSRSGHHPSDIRTGFHIKDLLAKINSFAQENKHQLPLLAYYPVNRAVLDIPLRIRVRHDFGVLDAYEGALTGGVNFRTFFEWFREREDIENEKIRNFDQCSGNVENCLDSQLNAVRAAILVFMPDFNGLTVRRSPLRMEVTKQGKKLRVDQLSDGEKCLMAMVGDIARRLAIANPHRKNPLHSEGIVLIDEIDLHLHPTWQHMIVPQLLQTFPKCQFLISTHSPHVITHVSPNQLFSMNMRKGVLTVEQPRESYGKNAERVYEDIMGMETTRPKDVKTAIEKIYNLIDRNNLVKAKKEIESLQGKIGKDSELFRAAALIKRKEITGK